MNWIKIFQKENKHKRKWSQMKQELQHYKELASELSIELTAQYIRHRELQKDYKLAQATLKEYIDYKCKDGVCEIPTVDVEIVEDPRAEFLGINQYYNVEGTWRAQNEVFSWRYGCDKQR